MLPLAVIDAVLEFIGLYDAWVNVGTGFPGIRFWGVALPANSVGAMEYIASAVDNAVDFIRVLILASPSVHEHAPAGLELEVAVEVWAREFADCYCLLVRRFGDGVLLTYVQDFRFGDGNIHVSGFAGALGDIGNT